MAGFGRLRGWVLGQPVVSVIGGALGGLRKLWLVLVLVGCKAFFALDGGGCGVLEGVGVWGVMVQCQASTVAVGAVVFRGWGAAARSRGCVDWGALVDLGGLLEGKAARAAAAAIADGLVGFYWEVDG